jgi:hypothetical protein
MEVDSQLNIVCAVLCQELSSRLGLVSLPTSIARMGDIWDLHTDTTYY